MKLKKLKNLLKIFYSENFYTEKIFIQKETLPWPMTAKSDT